MAALHRSVLGHRVPDAVQRFLSGAPQSRDLHSRGLSHAMGPGRSAALRAALRPGHEPALRSPGQNIPSWSMRFFLFERCQTTPGKPFNGTNGSPV